MQENIITYSALSNTHFCQNVVFPMCVHGNDITDMYLYDLMLTETSPLALQ